MKNMKYILMLLIITSIMSFVIFTVGKEVLDDRHKKESLRIDGIETMAVVTSRSSGAGRSGRSYIYYKFFESNNQLIESRDEVGYTLFQRLKKNDNIMIIYSPTNPEINAIKDNDSTSNTHIGFFIFFLLGTVLLFYAILRQFKK